MLDNVTWIGAKGDRISFDASTSFFDHAVRTVGLIRDVETQLDTLRGQATTRGRAGQFSNLGLPDGCGDWHLAPVLP